MSFGSPHMNTLSRRDAYLTCRQVQPDKVDSPDTVDKRQTHTMNDFEILAKLPPPAELEGMSISDLNARMYALETKLGKKHRPPIFSRANLVAKIMRLEYEAQHGGATLTHAQTHTMRRPIVPPAVAQLPLSVTQTPAIAPVIADAQLVITAAQYCRMTALERSNYAERGGELAAAEFEQLNPKARMEFMKAGGRIADEPDNTVTPRASGHVPVTPHP